MNTRWASIVNMFVHMIKYRRAVETCFQAQSARLQTRLPAPRDWLVVATTVDIMRPVMTILLYSQTKSYFLLSDVLLKLVEPYVDFKNQLRSIPVSTTDISGQGHMTFQNELLVLKKRMLESITSEISGLLDFLRVYKEDCVYIYCNRNGPAV